MYVYTYLTLKYYNNLALLIFLTIAAIIIKLAKKRQTDFWYEWVQDNSLFGILEGKVIKNLIF